MEILQRTRNSHVLKVPCTTRTKELGIIFLTDIHWDNPKCQRELLKKHLDYALKNNIPVVMPGDLFCLMQGKYDPRRSKKDILPEHNTANYLDAVIEDAVDWFKPYADVIKLIGYGNHETAIIKNCETDPLRRFVDLLNYTAKPDNKVCLGGYGGWLNVQVEMQKTYNIRYYHGSGGGGVVTRGEINLSRALAMYDNMDCFVMGHIHENKATNAVVNTLNHKGIPENRNVHLMVTGTYKEEYEDGYAGWHVERGAPPKPLGGRQLNLTFIRNDNSTEVVTRSTEL